MSSPDALIGGRYRLVQRIAAGGMGSVWEAWDEVLHRRVALKQLHPQPGLSQAEADLARERAMREARITARLHHAHAVPVYDIVDHDGMPCMVMQFLPAKSLQELIAENGALDVAQVARIGREIASALAAAHQLGIVHRDVKPGNVLIDEDGAAKLTDFGISHALGDATLTATGMVTGTPAFLAPEVARGVASSAASDVFSLGSTLYAALEGSPPFGNETNPMAMLHTVASGRIIPPRRSGALTPVLHRMLAPDPASRPSMQEAAQLVSRVRSRPAAGSPVGASESPPTPPGPPPSTTVTLPAQAPRSSPAQASPGAASAQASQRVASAQAPSVTGPQAPPRTPAQAPRRRRRRGAGLAVLAAAVVAGIGAVLAVLLTPGSGSGPGATNSTQRQAAPAVTPRSTDRSASPPPRRSSSSLPSSTSAPSSTAATGTPTTTQLTQALTSYYALLPANTDMAWARLTARYQSGHAGGRQGYEQFWKGIDSVAVSGVTANPPGSVEATVTYRRSSGTSTERTSFQLVRQDGVLKIDSSTVLSSS